MRLSVPRRMLPAVLAWLRRRRRPRYTPQTDVPLWRGTDLPDPPSHVVVEVGAVRRIDPSLAGAILALGYATDETAARYWLSVCARRGADADLLRELRETWEQQQRSNVTYLHTYREDPRT